MQKEKTDLDAPQYEDGEVNSIHELQIKPEVEKKLVRTLDYRLMIWAFFGYFANGLDRNNMPNAQTTGLSEDLNLVSNQYNWALTMFFIGYIVLQIPANYIITKVRPSIMLPLIVFTWGAVVCFMSLVKNYQGLYGLRLCLGLCEAGFYPGIVFLIGSWYTKEELGTRTCVFVAGSQISGAFSGLISGAIAQGLDGINGMRGWKWLFIIEGLIAVVIGIVGFFVIPDFPHNTRFIQGEMREVAMIRLERQGRSSSVSGLNMTTFRNLFTTPFIYLFLCMFICMQMGMGILQNFVIILKDIGYSSSMANYLMVPIWVWVGVVVIAQGYLSDKYSHRAYHILGGSLFTLVWYIVLVAVNGGNLPTPLLFVCAYMVVPIYGVSPIMMTWVNETYAVDRESRALAIAIINSLGNLVPNFVNVKVWSIVDAPAFRLGKIVTMCLTALIVVLCLTAFFLQRNKILVPKAPQRVIDEEMDNKKTHIVQEDEF
ncbi:major facilitator superfamily domain-containing protein [Gilbertella persicaria]|uniref:major facilitator superfamily domain-containing protein n=1 Tax=Gilbertella persicaria TaxID=101096 RepID=UPI002220DFA3|nr:major facilitator superfamily domain-containing protein [Gilbertella persicaria]KAI8090232.1 major facilitator superfamily domain-containing protein [Gilbertella persicaria]